MKPLFRSFAIFLRQIARDSMLYAVCFAPLLYAFLFRFGVPWAEDLLCGYFGRASVLSGYYLLFDLFLAALTPFLFCFASAMVILTEKDENMAAYMAVTPVGRRGYVASRLLYPAGLSFFASVALVAFFSLTVWPLWMNAAVSALASLMSVAVCLLVVSMSGNRVEGMAVSKLSGIALLGLIVPFFVNSGAQYLFSPLPSFWIAKLCAQGQILYALPALAASFLWIAALYRRFERKLK